MKKVIVIGCPGSGKSTLARKLEAQTGIPVFYLDKFWHKPDKTNYTESEFDEKLAEVLAQDEWIIDGNYLRTLDIRMENCDTVIFLDIPVAECIAGVEERIKQQNAGSKRSDMPWAESEFDPEFRQWILDFPKDQLPVIREALAKYRGSREILIFTSHADADAWLDTREYQV